MSPAGYCLNLHINSPLISPMRRLAALLMIVVIASPAVSWAANSTATSTSISISFESGTVAPAVRLRWPNNTIKVAFSKSLTSPGANIKLGSDVLGAVRRALSRWSAISDIVFETVESDLQSVSPARAGDGISLITVADTLPNNSIFNGTATAGRTRVFFDKETGEISEADIIINPHPTSADGLPVQFSTDGTRGTYDLESTFTHEIGHLLGLDHSPMISSTMHPHQALNGVYDRPAFTERTPSEEDRLRIRSLYDAAFGLGLGDGLIKQLNALGQRTPLSQEVVWVEDTTSGRLLGSALTSTKESLHLDNAPSSYRIVSRNMTFVRADGGNLYRATNANEQTTSSLLLANRYLNPRFIGAAGELSTTPVPLDAGTTVTVYIAGEGLDQISPNGISVTSPFFKVDAASIQKRNFSASYPVVSFDLRVAANAPFGDYTIRLQSKTSEIAFVPGALTVDPGVETSLANPSDDARFFVRQHYRDFYGREADTAGLDYWRSQLEQCGDDENCLRARRVKVAAAFVSQPEFEEKAGFVHRLYRVAFGRIPRFSEFEMAREILATAGLTQLEARAAVVRSVVESAEFRELYPDSLPVEDFLDKLLFGIRDASGVNLLDRRSQLLTTLKRSGAGRLEVIETVADDPGLIDAERDRVFLLIQFFGYLQRDAEENDFRQWMDVLKNSRKNDQARFASVTCAFVNSIEYQLRFGMVLTHTPHECSVNQ
jgi:hypothetical protein